MAEEINVADENSVSGGEALQMFGSDLRMKISRLSAERKNIEYRWVEDMRQYHGQYAPNVIANMPVGGSRVFVNVTRTKTDRGEAQLVDMLFPADDKNYGISPTPNPDLAASASSSEQVYDKDGNALRFADDKSPLTAGDVAKATMEQAEVAAKAMEREIDDQLVECEYGYQARKLIHYAALLGTGVVCAPEVEYREQAAWVMDGENYVNVFKRDKRPVARHVPTWDFFPDLSASTIDECEFIFERSYISKKSLRKMRRIPGVNKENLRKLVEECDGKSTQTYSEHVSTLREMSGIISMVEDNRYELWRRHGPIKRDILRAAGVQFPEGFEIPSEMDGIVIFCGDQVLKVSINPMESEEWPYSVFCWNKDDNCIFGTGIPYSIRNGQSVVNTSWRLMLDNSTKSAGPQIVRDHRIVPDDDSYDITPWKSWKKTDSSMDVDKAFKVFEFPNFQGEIANIYAMAKELIDEESGLPAISQGEQGQVTPTLGGMSMLMNAAGTVRRKQVKAFDDDVTVPVIKRFYDWNMQFNPRKEIKGDMRVSARGTSALLVKEQQSQALFAVLDKYAGHPVLSRFFKAEGLAAFRKAIQSLHINPDDIIKDEDQYAADLEAEKKSQEGQEPPQDPRILAEQLRGENRMRELNAEHQMRQSEGQLTYEIARMKMQSELARLANDKDISLAQLDADLKKAGWKLDLDKSMFTSELQLKQFEGVTANYGLGDQ